MSFAGGLVGYNTGIIEDGSYATGNVTSTSGATGIPGTGGTGGPSGVNYSGGVANSG